MMGQGEANMTKKHFIAIADWILAHNKWSATPFTQDQLLTLADFYKAQNPQFNRDRWLGYIAGTNGPNGGKVK